MSEMKVIILAAGQGYQLDGFNKLLIKDPSSGKTIIEKFISAFEGKKIIVVVGYRAINVMNRYPELTYVYNGDWAVTNNSYSLSLALDDSPCYVVSGDLLIERELIEALDAGRDNLVVTAPKENRPLNALNVVSDGHGQVVELYQGPLRSQKDPEAIGLFKISSSNLLRIWKKNCREHKNLFVGQNLPFDGENKIHAVSIGEHRLDEVNTPEDYIRLLENRN